MVLLQSESIVFIHFDFPSLLQKANELSSTFQSLEEYDDIHTVHRVKAEIQSRLMYDMYIHQRTLGQSGSLTRESGTDLLPHIGA